MSALLTQSPLFAEGQESPPARTLEDVIAGAWETLRSGIAAGCPVCGAELAPRFSAGAGAVGGRCGGCGSTLG